MNEIDDTDALKRTSQRQSAMGHRASSSKAYDDLERLVNERTSQLSAINAKLTREIAERERSEFELTRLKDELSADLKAMVRLHELSTRLISTNELPKLLDEILEAAIELLHGDFGEIQLFDPDSEGLQMVAQRGCKDESHNVHSTPFFSRSGETLGVISTHFRKPHRPSADELRFMDLYAHLAGEFIERRRTEEELRKTQAELAHVTRLTTVGELTASIAHEVNQPLGAIVTNGHACLHLLSRNKPDLEEVRQAVECIIADGIRAGEVIKRVRRLAKKSSGGKSSHSINNIVREVLSLVAVELARNNINVQPQLALNLPFVLVDRIQIQQVVLNLILNSKEAMSVADWRPRDLGIQTERTGAEVMVTVTDTGVGISDEDRQRAFEPFFTTKDGGLGLGLSISKTIIDAHGGRLWIKSCNDGHGTTAQFTLPTV